MYTIPGISPRLLSQGSKSLNQFIEDLVQPKTGWWLGKKPSEKYEFVSWDDEKPNIHGKIQKKNKATSYHQPDTIQ